MFNKILIANRGEIAVRVIRSARSMGLATVAVYSDADAGALHVALADEAVRIGEAAPAASYLRSDAIIAAARETGAEAIHPGYGFLSENPNFVAAVEAAGLVFIGPSADAIRKMGLKDAAKALMEEAGVPVVPGYHGADQDGATLARAADDIGYPVLIKAVAGGGGKGMRLVEAPGEFDDALASARSEAETAFGNSDVLVEKFVSTPRHIEVQVFGDGTRALHLFERDCSLQRRHQKVIEEAPAPGMTDEMRAAMGAAAVRAAEAIGYSGAGTVEFIVDGSGPLRPDGFWFMEMNTRLQVEHPVTEEITGVDLVAWQIRVAAGESLPVAQADLAIDGHAFEARLYAEDVPAGFLPATGRLDHLVFGPDARAETGVRAGDRISPHYDPMIAKLVTHGPTREIALARLSRALAETEVAGTVTNLAFLGALAAHPDFRAGRVDTGLIGRDIDALAAAPAVDPRAAVWAAMVALGLDWAPGDRDGFTLWQPLPRDVVLRHRDDTHAARVTLSAPGSARIAVRPVADDAEAASVGLASVGLAEPRLAEPGLMSPEPADAEATPETVIAAEWTVAGWRLGGRPAPAHHAGAGRITVFVDHGCVFEPVDPLARAQMAASGDVIEAPMPGLVRTMLAVQGAAVQAGDRLAVLEAMKMQHALTAPRDGVVAEVLVTEGAQVEAGAALVRLESED